MVNPDARDGSTEAMRVFNPAPAADPALAAVSILTVGDGVILIEKL